MLCILISDNTSMNIFSYSIILSISAIIGVSSGNNFPPNRAIKYSWSKMEKLVNADCIPPRK